MVNCLIKLANLGLLKESYYMEIYQGIKKYLSRVPFKQIDKNEIALANAHMNLFIIGNGFDLIHSVPSSYFDFRNSMLLLVLEGFFGSNIYILLGLFKPILSCSNKLKFSNSFLILVTF